MSLRSRRLILLPALLGLWALLVSCPSPRETEERPNMVRAHLSGDPASLSLLGKTDKNAEILAVQITDSLVQYDGRLDLQPRLAESWKFSDDHRTVTFNLRRGVRWHDGRPLTAEDVVFSVEKVREPAVQNYGWAPRFVDLVRVEALDERTVRAQYGVATPDLLDGWCLPILPRHLAGRDEDLLTGEFARHPVGCGPFRFVRYTPGQEIVLEANDDYWDGRPAIDALVFKIYPDQRTAYQALLSGGLDIMTVTSNLWNEARSSPRGARLASDVQRLFSVWLVGWNLDGSNPFFTDPRVRRAMVLALDRERFNAGVLFGHARPGASTFHSDTVWADPDLEPWPYDPAEAARLLDEAGWSDSDGDGVRDKAGRPFEFELLTPSSTQKLVEHLAVWQQQSWAEIGVRARIERIEWRSFLERRNSRRFEVLEYTLLFTPIPDQFELYHSSAREGGMNFWGLDDPEIDRLLDRGRREFDPETRREIYYRLQRRLHELEPVTALFYFASPVLHDPRLQGITLSPLGYFTTAQGPRLWHWADASAADAED